MAEAELLAKVKLALGETGDFADNMLSVYIDEILDYMKNAGVSDSIANASAGVVARGVSDLWDNDGGNVKFSAYFHERVTQLALKSRSDSA
ncbi:MAG: phage gp6-like head-tail connector protein [Oscillospiraceae bacterium]|nr:phage gp6-like head-tail connector protein [Oscillospiraceae bacterium]